MIETKEQLKAEIKSRLERQFERVCQKLDNYPEIADEVIADDTKHGSPFMNLMTAIGKDLTANYAPMKGQRAAAARIRKYEHRLWC